ncbi:ribosomal protein L4 [Melanogaster broomeanus]|nr:ribosomal protein L4 [Melanogaster broomeanus]
MSRNTILLQDDADDVRAWTHPLERRSETRQLLSTPRCSTIPSDATILHLCSVQYLDSLRQGSANTKTRAEVRGSGRKIRPQKGTGKARLGDGQSPMLRGGGVAFGPKPRDFSTKLNRKVIQMGMRVALSVKVKEQRLGVVPRVQWYCHKTVTLENRLDKLGWRTGTLFVSGMPQIDTAIKLAGRNLRGLEFKHVDELNVYDLVKWRRVILDLPAVSLLESKLSKAPIERPEPDAVQQDASRNV